MVAAVISGGPPAGHDALVAIVMAHRFEFEAERVVPERGVVMAGVLRKMLRVVDNYAANPHDVVMHLVHQRPVPHDERQVFKPVRCDEYSPGCAAG